MAACRRRRRRAGAAAPSGRGEVLAGYLFIALPMLLFLVLHIGAIVYALYISVWDWNVRSGAGRVPGARRTTQDVLADPIFQKAIQNTSTTRWCGSR